MTTDTTTTHVTGNPGELGEVTITRDFAAPRELVFAAFFDPEQLAQFWGPTGTHAPVEHIVIEARPGGRFETLMVADDGSGEFPTKAVFVEIDEPESFSFIEPDAGMTTASTFTDLGDGRTRLVIHQTQVPEMYRSPDALAGFLTSLDRFDAYLATVA